MNLFWKIIGIIIAIPLLYVIGNIVLAQWTYFRPEPIIVLSQSENPDTLALGTYTAMSWNIGYCGLGAKSDFFKDGGKMVRPDKKEFESYFDGVMTAIQHDSSDFQLLQEVDTFSKRSYFQDQVSFIRAQGHQSHPFSYFGENYRVRFVPVPFLEPMGRVQSGLLSLSKYKPYKVERHQLPGEFGFPTQLFFLRRCLLIQYYKMENGKSLIVINVHNSAYDDDGKLKKQEMDYLKNILESEVSKGNYVICGGDWNQCPPDFPYTTLAKGKEGDYFQTNVDSNFLSSGGWSYDRHTATNRKNDKAYDRSKTFVTIIDFYWHSDNIEMIACKVNDLDFKFSDHQPVKLNFILK